MAFGDFVGRMGDVAVGMEDMAGKMQRRQLDAQRAEAQASAIRGQQREENDAQRLAELNRRMVESMGRANSPQGFDVQSHETPPAAQPLPAAAAARNDNYGNEGRAAITGGNPEYMASRDQYRKLQAAEQARLDAMRRVAPKGDVVRSTNNMMSDMQQRIDGYAHGARAFDDLATEQAATKVGGLDLQAAVRHVESRGNMNAVSPKGAKSDMQVMDATNAQPGFGVTPARDGSLGERSRVGKDYLAALQRHYGDDTKALVAYNWGPGNADKWIAAGANPNALPPETAKYVRDVMALAGGAGTTQPQAAASADPRGILQTPQQAAPQAQGQFQTVGGTDYDPSADQRAFMQNYLTQVVQTSRNPQVQQQAMQQLMGLRLDDANAKVTSIGHAATMGNPQALQQLVSMYAGPGNRIGVAKLSDGQVGLVTPQGQVVEAFRDEATLANALVTKLNTSLQQQKAAIGAKAAEKYAVTQAEAGAKAPYEQAVEMIKRDAALNAEFIKGDAKVREELVKQVAVAQQYGRASVDGQGNVVALRNDGSVAMVVSPGSPDKRGIMGAPKVHSVANPGLQVPAGRG